MAVRVFSSISVKLHRKHEDCTEAEARARMKQAMDDITEPFQRIAKERGIWIKVDVEQLTSQEE